MEKMSMIYETLLSVHADMVLAESLRSHREQQLYQEIDQALLQGNQFLFLKLTEELKNLQAPYSPNSKGTD